MAKCYTNLGNAYHELGDFRMAIEYHEKSLGIYKEIGDVAGEAKCYTNLGAAYGSLGDFRKAIEYHEKSLEIAKEIGDIAGESTCYINLGIAYRNLRDFRKAIEYYEKSLEIAREMGDIDSERIINLNLCQIYYEDKPELSYDYCKHSIELSEVIGGRLVEEEHKIGFYARASEAYQGIVPLCLKLEKENEAFEYVERSKSRAFLDLLAVTRIRPAIALTSELKLLLDSEEIHLAKLREIQIRHLRKTYSSVEPGEIDRIFEKLNEIYDKIEKFDSEYVFIRRGKPLSLSKIQEILSQKRNAIIVEYFVTTDRTFIFVVTIKELHIKTIQISAEKLSRYIAAYWREVVNYHRFGDIGNTWLELSSYLIEPVSQYLSKSDMIYFVPYGLLHYIPIHALELNGEPLIKRHAIAYSPSASLLKFCKNKGSGSLKSCASFGIVFKEEAENIAELFNTKANLDATRNKVLENIDKDILHFSCHGYFNDIDPLSSGVKLHDDVLTAREIFNLKLNTELVTLSACQTGLNERSPGDELIGVTRAFLYAGAPSIVVSLWSVNVRSTQELMLEFYKLLKKGEDKATALQEAQKIIMAKKEYSHPYYWAPFVLVGDWE
jgi:CHAT domain-containing protein